MIDCECPTIETTMVNQTVNVLSENIDVSSETNPIDVTVETQAIQLSINPSPIINLELSSVAIVPSSISGWSNFGQGTPKQVSVGDTSTQLLASNDNRLFARINNNSDKTIYIQYSIDAVWSTGQVIRPNGSYIIDITELYKGVIKAVTQSGATAIIDVTEGVA